MTLSKSTLDDSGARIDMEVCFNASASQVCQALAATSLGTPSIEAPVAKASTERSPLVTGCLGAAARARLAGGDKQEHLAEENKVLRSALRDLGGRVAELEGEQQQLLIESVFELANS